MELQTIGDPKAKIKVLAATNVLSNVDSAVYDDHIDQFYQIAKGGKYYIYRWAPRRMSIDRMRNVSAENALGLECDYLWFIDDDMLLSPGTLDSLVAADKDIIMADTIIRGYPYHSMSFKKTGHDANGEIGLEHYDDILEAPNVNGVVDCEAIGFACALLKTSLLKKLSKPWFCTTPNGTEDIYYCLRCKQEIQGETTIAVDLKVPTWHRLDPIYITRKTIPVMKEFMEKLNLESSKTSELEWRGNDYNKMVEAL